MGIIALCVTLVIGDLLERRHMYRIPEAVVGLAVGGVCAAIATLTDNAEMLHDRAFDDQFFMVWLLPPIIFAAGFNMKIPHPQPPHDHWTERPSPKTSLGHET